MRHWTMLLFADRVDSLEHRLRKASPLLATGLVGWFALARFAGGRGRKKRR
jgi:hypothetical protein